MMIGKRGRLGPLTLVGFVVILAGLEALWGASINEGDSVVLVYNRNLPESLAVAEHYAARRSVPRDHLVGLDLPETESMTRESYERLLETPLLARFRDQEWFQYDYEVIPASREQVGGVIKKVKEASVRYLALCYGVPLKVQPDDQLAEEGKDAIRIELRRNEASVDSELAVLPFDRSQRRIYGPLRNPAYGVTNAVTIRPEMGILMVTRLDGPSPELAKQLVDRAIQAEEEGLWGRAYFDLRGITSGEYKLGDDWIAKAAEFSRQVGLETYVDREAATFPETLPLSQVGLYAGWYETHVTGPFALDSVEFMPGAIAYHLHSFSAQTIRSSSQNWVGPLVHRGATATMGCVYEPYLALTPNLEVFFARLFQGFGLAEAAYASQQAVSWQTTVVGDPLYRPYGKPLSILRADLSDKKSQLVEWLDLISVNRALVNETSTLEDVIEVMRGNAAVQMSAVLTEKLGDLYRENSQRKLSEETYYRALELNPSPQQALRIRLRIAALLRLTGDRDKGVRACLAVATHHPGYVGVRTILEDALAWARQGSDTVLISQVEEKLSGLGDKTP